MSHPARQSMLPGMGADDDSVPIDPPAAPTGDDSPVQPSQAGRGRPALQSCAPLENQAARQPDLPPLANLAGETVWVIDANSLIFQVFHAIPEMTSPQGEPVNAVFGFVRDLLFLMQVKKPTFLFCAFDMSGRTFRHELYADYKIHRADMPEELAAQYPAIRRAVEALGIPLLELPEYEADDILATIARAADELEGECYLVTGDKDCRQLISDRVKVYNVRKNQVYDAVALAADWGIRPDQVVDYQALVGDPVDHVPGVPLIGPKIASELLQKYETLDAVFEHAHEVAGPKRRQNLIDGREQALLSRKLVRLDAHVPVEIDWNQARVGGFDVARVQELFGEFGFHRFAEQLRELDLPQPAAVWQADYRTIDSPAAFQEFLAELERQPRFSFDTETTDLSPSRAEIVGYSFAWKPGEAYYLPVRAPAGEKRLDPAETLAALRDVLENPEIGKIGQNLKYDMVVLRAAGVELRGVEFDTMVASYLLDAGERNHNLDELAQRYLNHANIKISELIGSGKRQKRMDEVPVAAITAYAAEDADVPLRLSPILTERLGSSGLTELFETLELPLIETLVELEHNGIRVDADRLAELSRQYGERVAALEAEVYDLAGHPFNIASTKQLQQVLFEEQKLPVLAKTKTGASTDAEVLEELARLHPLPAKIIEYRQFAKLKNTYVDALPQLVNPRTGRVHASFNQSVAATGRLSSSDPNLQNIPIRTESGREIRSAFLPGHEGWQLLAADYSQIELRVLAHFSGDETLCEAFANDEDIHALVASQVYGVPQAEVTGSMRRAAKAVNFGVIYGQSPFGLAKALNISQEEAARFIDEYFGRYPGVEKFLTKILADCREKGYVSTVMGRRRAIRGIRPVAPDADGIATEASRQRNLSERTAINTVIQGSAADLIKLAMIAIHRRLRRESLAAKMLLQIHDELIFEVPAHELDRLAKLVAEEMAAAQQLAVPLKVDVKIGRNWAEVEPWEG